MNVATANRTKTACKRGHPFTRTNTRGDRVCILCARERERFSRWRRDVERAAE